MKWNIVITPLSSYTEEPLYKIMLKGICWEPHALLPIWQFPPLVLLIEVFSSVFMSCWYIEEIILISKSVCFFHFCIPTLKFSCYYSLWFWIWFVMAWRLLHPILFLSTFCFFFGLCHLHPSFSVSFISTSLTVRIRSRIVCYTKLFTWRIYLMH
jgi:hypothetical protein